MESYVNVYDISQGVNKYFSWAGLGAYHTGVVVGSREYTFSDSGIITHEPLHAGEGAVFKEALPLGTVRAPEVSSAVARLRATFARGSYDLTRRNCNHFTQALVGMLFPSKSLPGYINRAAGLGARFAPRDTHPDQDEAKTSAELKKEAKERVTAEKEKEKARHQKKEMTEKQKQMLAKLKKPAKNK